MVIKIASLITKSSIFSSIERKVSSVIMSNPPSKNKDNKPPLRFFLEKDLERDSSSARSTIKNTYRRNQRIAPSGPATVHPRKMANARHRASRFAQLGSASELPANLVNSICYAFFERCHPMITPTANHRQDVIIPRRSIAQHTSKVVYFWPAATNGTRFPIAAAFDSNA